MHCLQTATLPLIKTIDSRQQIFFKIICRDVYESSWLLVVVAYAPDFNPVHFTGLQSGVPVPLLASKKPVQIFNEQTTCIRIKLKLLVENHNRPNSFPPILFSERSYIDSMQGNISIYSTFNITNSWSNCVDTPHNRAISLLKHIGKHPIAGRDVEQILLS